MDCDQLIILPNCCLPILPATCRVLPYQVQSKVCARSGRTQALVSSAAYGTPQRSATGFDQRRLNMLLAVLEKRVGFKLMQKDVFLNIAGGLRITDMAMDLSVIAAVFIIERRYSY